MELVTFEGDKLTLNFHSGQLKAHDSTKQIVAVLAGTRSGKTSYGPWWLEREIRERGPGDYLVAAPSYKLLDKGAAPEIEYVFQSLLKLGRLQRSPSFHFAISRQGELALWGARQPRRSRILFGHADDPESLEAMTAKAVWLDEAGQKRFKYASWQAIRRRRSFHRGRTLVTTTPYNLGWLKQVIYDPWKASGGQHPLIDVIRFDSTANPAFPREEWEQAQLDLPAWKFNLFFRAIFTRPAGLIYDNFNQRLHVVPRFPIPDHWRRFGGIDFGGVNLVALKYAQHPETGVKYLYQSYAPKTHKAISAHVQALKAGEACYDPARGLSPIKWVGGAKSEEQWRIQFREAGLPIEAPPIHEVELGINRVYAAHNADEIIVFSDQKGYLDQKLSYSRELDEMDNPKETIEDKEEYHYMDAERYIASYWRKNQRNVGAPLTGGRGVLDDLPKDLFRDRG